MLRNRPLVIVMLVLGLTCLACHRMEPALPELPYAADEELVLTPGGFSDAIPADYGRLVNVSLYPTRPRVAYLWFEAPDGTITMVRVDVHGRKVVEGALTIPRR
jgi:hypothetical protein